MLSPCARNNSQNDSVSYSFLLSDDDENADETLLNRSRHSIATNRSRLSIASVGSQNSFCSAKSRFSIGSGNSSPYKRTNLNKLSCQKAFFEALPKNIFQMPGTFALWYKLIGTSKLTETQAELLKNKIKSYSYAEKYAFARLIVYRGFEVALKLDPVVATSDMIAFEHLPEYRLRRFVDVSTQTSA